MTKMTKRTRGKHIRDRQRRDRKTMRKKTSAKQKRLRSTNKKIKRSVRIHRTRKMNGGMNSIKNALRKRKEDEHSEGPESKTQGQIKGDAAYILGSIPEMTRYIRKDGTVGYKYKDKVLERPGNPDN